MITDEQERAAYARGDLITAALLARVADLQAALGRATAEIDILTDELYAARQEQAYGDEL